jgi:hypothetical protein
MANSKKAHCNGRSAALRTRAVNPVADPNGATRCSKKNPPGVNRRADSKQASEQRNTNVGSRTDGAGIGV